MKFFIASIASLFICRFSFAQKDSVKQQFSFFLGEEISRPKIYHDTDLTLFQITNAIYTMFPVNGYLGNIGSETERGFYIDNDLKFKTGFKQFDVYHYTQSPVGFRDQKPVSTRIIYTRGSKKENYLDANHYQHILKNLAGGFDYGRIYSVGQYKNQSTDFTKFDIYLIWELKNHRYGFFADFVANKIINDENGGLQESARLDTTARSAWSTVPVNLDDGKCNRKERKYVFSHQYNFVVDEHIREDDSVVTYSTPRFFLHHDFLYERESFLFKNTIYSDDYFDNIYFDTIPTYDSTFAESFSNKVYIGYTNSDSRYHLNAGIYQQQFQYLTYDSILTKKDLLNVTGDFSLKFNKVFLLFADASINVMGAIGAYNLNSYLNYNLNQKLKFKLTFISKNEIPETIKQLYISNHFIWNNDFKNTSINSLALSGETKWLSLSLRHTVLHNYIYYNQDKMPEQISNPVSVSDLKIGINLKAGNWGFSGAYILQNCDENNIIALPAFNSITTIFYGNSAFKKALYFQVGIDCKYNSSYYANSFMPETGQFYNQTKIKTGNYFFVDPFISARIQTVKLFLKLDNSGARFWGDNYYMTPYYPLFGRALKFGIEWRFYD